MALDLNDEILQDFLVEGGEILEELNEQLVDLEQTPDDPDLLNAVFRGFHTIKGGAGFLNIEALVEVCHSAENVFDVLRQGKRHIDADLMDAVLQVIDLVNVMFTGIQEGIEPRHADPALIQTLNELAVPEGEASEADQAEVIQEAKPEPKVEAQPAMATNAEEALDELLSVAGSDEPEKAAGGDDITEEEFEKLLDELHGEGKFSSSKQSAGAKQQQAKSATSSEDITEDEFENLLDELHGKGKFTAATPAVKQQTPKVNDDSKASSGEITEDEFEDLLDELHGKGKFSKPAEPVKKTAATAKPAVKKDEPKPTPPKAENKKAPAAMPKSPPAETTVRVDTQRLDDIMNMVGELVLVRNRLATLKASMENEEVAAVLSNLDVVTSDLQLAVMKTRMQPIKKVFGRFPRVVRELARSLNKEIDL